MPSAIRQSFICLFTATLLLAGYNLCAQRNSPNVGDITFDSKTDNSKFQFCNPDLIAQEYELKSSSDESNSWISEQLKEKFVHNPLWKNNTGFITIRFAVNCFGLTDRFRAKAVNTNLQSIEFSADLSDYLIKLVKEIKWPVKSYHMKTFDYYQDVTFKMIEGQVTEVVL